MSWLDRWKDIFLSCLLSCFELGSCGEKEFEDCRLVEVFIYRLLFTAYTIHIAALWLGWPSLHTPRMRMLTSR